VSSAKKSRVTRRDNNVGIPSLDIFTVTIAGRD
jgi:hypothetical protein